MRFIKSPFSFLRPNNRVVLYDMLKFFAMTLVVLGHCLTKWSLNFQSTQFSNYIFITEMPLFMFVSGIVSKKRINSIKDLFFALIKNFFYLIIPFISFSIIATLIDGTYERNIFVGIYKSILNPLDSLWFLWCLFWIQLIDLILVYIAAKVHNRFFSFSLFYGCFVVFLLMLFFLLRYKGDIFGIKLILYYSFYYLLGTVFSIACVQLINRIAKKHIYVIAIIGLVISISLMILCMALRPTMLYDEENLPNLLIRVIGSCSSIIFHLLVFAFLCKIRLMKSVAKFGILSLEFYFVHLLVLRIPICNNVFPISFIGVSANIGLFLFIYFVSFALIILAKTNYLTDSILFGKIPLYSNKK